MRQPPLAAELKMIGEDALWATDVSLSLSDIPSSGAAVVALCLFPHFARIVYESLRYLEAHQPDLAHSLRLRYSQQIGAARHSVKLFDDTSRGYEGIVQWFDVLAEAHKAAFTGQARWRCLRRFEKDLGLSFIAERLVTTTHVASYHIGIDPSVISDQAEFADRCKGASISVGQVLRALVEALHGRVPSPTVDLSLVGTARSRDYLTQDYLVCRFVPAFPPGVKGALMAMQSSVTAADLVLEPTREMHGAAVLRARVIVVSPVLLALQRVQAEFRDRIPEGQSAQIGALVNGPTALRLLSPQGRKLRNVAMHYGVDPSSPELDADKPMAGLVEGFLPDTTFGELSDDLHRLTREIADFLAAW